LTNINTDGESFEIGITKSTELRKFTEIMTNINEIARKFTKNLTVGTRFLSNMITSSTVRFTLGTPIHRKYGRSVRTFRRATRRHARVSFTSRQSAPRRTRFPNRHIREDGRKSERLSVM
jgi:hypothetical protein